VNSGNKNTRSHASANFRKFDRAFPPTRNFRQARFVERKAAGILWRDHRAQVCESQTPVEQTMVVSVAIPLNTSVARSLAALSVVALCIGRKEVYERPTIAIVKNAPYQIDNLRCSVVAALAKAAAQSRAVN
jgi:hypothetical protein